jgi:hypothetical protein
VTRFRHPCLTVAAAAGLTAFAAVTAATGAVAAAATAPVTALARPAAVRPDISGPFTAGTQSWCPSYHTYLNGCNGTDTPSSPAYANNFSPAQVSVSGSTISLAMNPAATSSGAVNTYSLAGPSEQPATPFTISESITLPCNSSGQVYNWPAFWTVGTGGTGKPWPYEGEIDIIEGLSGVPTWSYHYDNPATGAADDRAGSPAGSYCGTHTYEAKVTAAQLSIVWDGKTVGTVTAAEIGEPITSDPQYIINDYGTLPGSGGPVQGSETMRVASFTYSSP